MTKVTENIFTKGLLQDLSKYRLPNGYLLDAEQVQLTSRDGSNFAITKASGNELLFSLDSGFSPLSIVEYDQLLYICSINTATKQIELGTFRSPVGGVPNSTGIAEQNTYQPLYNRINDVGIRQIARFSYSELGITEDPKHIDMVLQLDYDNSINIILVSESFQPLIINSLFEYKDKKFYSTERAPYKTSESSLSHFKLLLDAANSVKITYRKIGPGGQLKSGSYRYYFSYLTEDFNETEIVGQSGPCQVFFGSGDKIRGGDETEVTPNRVQLTLSQIDDRFKYIQPYFTYLSGAETPVKQIIKFSKPLRITSESMVFTHSGVEEVDEIDLTELGIDFANIKSAKLATSAKGFMFLAGIVEEERRSAEIRAFAQKIILRVKTTTFPVTSDLYKNPENVYKYTGYFGGETYVFGMVGKYKGGGYTPVYPVQGYDYVKSQPTRVDGVETGVFRFPYSTDYPILQDGNIQVKHLEVFFGTVPDSIKELLSEIFLVRADRQNSSLIAQGAVIPTVTTPPVQYKALTDWDDLTYFHVYGDDLSKYKYFPVLDGLLEAHSMELVGDNYNVVNSNNIKEKDNLIFALANKLSDLPQSYQLDRWAFYSPESVGDAPKLNSLLSGASLVKRLAKINHLVQDGVSCTLPGFGPDYFPITSKSVGTRYDVSTMTVFPGNFELETAESIPEGTFSSGSDFISRMIQTLRIIPNIGVGLGVFLGIFHLNAFPYIGLKLKNIMGSRLANDVAGTIERIRLLKGSAVSTDIDLHPYQNLGTTVPGAYLVNLYSANPLDDAKEYYPNRDSIPYSQISERWNLSQSLPNAVKVYDGDCFIGKIYQRIYFSGYKDPQEGTEDRDNLDLGVIFSYFAESSRNPNLRHVYFANDSDIDKTTFYPYDKDFRAQRFSDSQIISPGYVGEVGEFTQFPNPEDIPDSKSSFYTRIFPSAQHIPNSFENGFRIFTTGWKDYPTNYGQITRLIGYNTDLIIIFEHGVGITPIQPRVVTGQDVAGEAFLKSEGVLTDAFGVISAQYGSQHSQAVKQTPHYIYGMDAQEGKIWRLGPDRKFDLLSEGVIGSKIRTMVNPRIGYDPKSRLVYFTSGEQETSSLSEGEFCYIFSEDLGKFTSRSDNTGTFYTNSARDGMIGFLSNNAHLYTEDSLKLYNNDFESVIEFVVNPEISLTKVFDYLNIVSNNTAPKSITLTAYNSDGTINQQSVINQGTNFFTQEPNIFYRDKRWVAQIPKVSVATYKELEWGLDNRLRDKYVVVKIVYDNSHLDFETIGVQTFYRNSQS